MLENQKRLTSEQKERATELLCEATELESDADKVLEELQQARETAEAKAVQQINVAGEVHPNVTIRFPGIQATTKKHFAGPVKIVPREIEGQKTITLVHADSGSAHTLESRPFADEAVDSVARLLAEKRA